ncbi:MAG: hypothetical protein RMJ98_20845, partial [Myxococcales bacterium]|nr:hypothetical protein [Myxococcales bacterium]
TDNELQLIMQMATEQAPAVRSVMPDLPEGMAQVIDRALAFDRERRYPDAAAMRADVLRVLSGEMPASNLVPGPAPAVGPTMPPEAPPSVAALSASAFPVSLAQSPSGVAPAPAYQPTPPTLVTSASLLSRQPIEPGGASQTPWQPASVAPAPTLPATMYPAQAALVPPSPGVSAVLERIGRKTIHLPIPVVVALAVVTVLLVGSAICTVLWRALARDKEPISASSPKQPHPHPTEQPSPTTTPPPGVHPIVPAIPTGRPTPTGGTLPGGNVPALPTQVLPPSGGNGKGNNKGKGNKKESKK